MNILLHTCCAPCSIKCLESLREEGFSPVLFWCNPNIHPFTEYRERRDTLVSYAESVDAELVIDDRYDVRTFAEVALSDFENRCARCYDVRLSETARFAAENDYDAFSTTLLISPYQDHDLIIKTAEKAAADYDVDFIRRDFRPLFREGQAAAKELGLYRQKYCGCIFSEQERYVK